MLKAPLLLVDLFRKDVLTQHNDRQAPDIEHGRVGRGDAFLGCEGVARGGGEEGEEEGEE